MAVDSATLTMEAQGLLNNPAFKQAVENLREHYTNALLATASNEHEKREELYRRVSVMGAVIAELADIAQNPIETAH